MYNVAWVDKEGFIMITWISVEDLLPPEHVTVFVSWYDPQDQEPPGHTNIKQSIGFYSSIDEDWNLITQDENGWQDCQKLKFVKFWAPIPLSFFPSKENTAELS
jgi:hypothetical protein